MLKLEDVGDIKSTTTQLNSLFIWILTNEKLAGTLRDYFDVSFIIPIHLSKYSFSLDTFWTQLVFWRKLSFHSLFISVLVNIASILILFWKYLVFWKKINVFFIIIYSCPGKYSFSHKTLLKQSVYIRRYTLHFSFTSIKLSLLNKLCRKFEKYATIKSNKK